MKYPSVAKQKTVLHLTLELAQIEWETLKSVDWYDNTRMHSAIGYVTPQEAEAYFYAWSAP